MANHPAKMKKIGLKLYEHLASACSALTYSWDVYLVVSLSCDTGLNYRLHCTKFINWREKKAGVIIFPYSKFQKVVEFQFLYHTKNCAKSPFLDISR